MTSFNARFSRLRSANICFRRRFSPSRSFIFFDISCFHPAVFRLPVVIAGFRDTCFTADILNISPGFDGLKNSDDLVLSKSDLTHSDLLRGHNQYVGRSLKVNGSFKRDVYTSADNKKAPRRTLCSLTIWISLKKD